MSRHPNVNVEHAAQIVYETWALDPHYVPWVRGGNAIKQDDARAVARTILRDTEKGFCTVQCFSGFFLGAGSVMFFVAMAKLFL